jgi:hypothetical protein
MITRLLVYPCCSGRAIIHALAAELAEFGLDNLCLAITV